MDKRAGLSEDEQMRLEDILRRLMAEGIFACSKSDMTGKFYDIDGDGIYSYATVIWLDKNGEVHATFAQSEIEQPISQDGFISLYEQIRREYNGSTT